jgi:hypothetical protein
MNPIIKGEKRCDVFTSLTELTRYRHLMALNKKVSATSRTAGNKYIYLTDLKALPRSVRETFLKAI